MCIAINDLIEKNELSFNVGSAFVSLASLNSMDRDYAIVNIETAIWHLQREVKLLAIPQSDVKHGPENEIYDSLKRANEKRIARQTDRGFCMGSDQ